MTYSLTTPTKPFPYPFYAFAWRLYSSGMSMNHSHPLKGLIRSVIRHLIYWPLVRYQMLSVCASKLGVNLISWLEGLGLSARHNGVMMNLTKPFPIFYKVLRDRQTASKKNVTGNHNNLANNIQTNDGLIKCYSDSQMWVRLVVFTRAWIYIRGIYLGHYFENHPGCSKWNCKSMVICRSCIAVDISGLCTLKWLDSYNWDVSLWFHWSCSAHQPSVIKKNGENQAPFLLDCSHLDFILFI